jgi:hypothetical protein
MTGPEVHWKDIIDAVLNPVSARLWLHVREKMEHITKSLATVLDFAEPHIEVTFPVIKARTGETYRPTLK